MNCKLTTLFLLGAATFASSILAGVVLLADGECETLRFDIPDLSSGAFPAGSRWKGGTGSPRAYDNDVFRDDYMGPASIVGGHFEVEVCNHSGDLSGPNGDPVNGGFETDIEVMICAIFEYPVSRSVGFGCAPEGVGPSCSSTLVRWKRQAYYTGEICVTPV